MSRNRIVVVNMLATYGRMVLMVGLTLLSSRWILAGLGQVDYGLYMAVGGIYGFLSFLNIAMSFSVQRYLAYSIGGGDADEVNRWFNAALTLHLALAVVLLAIGIPVGVWALHHLLNIPPDRLSTCAAVFACTVLSCFANVVSVPFSSMFIAKQRIVLYTVITTASSCLTFVLAYLLLHVTADRLRFYAVGMLAVQLATLVCQAACCLARFPECRVTLARWGDSQRLKKLLGFTGWSMVSTMAYIMRGQGIVLMLNVHGGPAVNSAFGIANQVSGQAGALSGGMMNAVAPEITASEGGGDRGRMLSLSMRSCKFATLLTLLPLIPLMADMDNVLRLWLREVPAHTGLFCQIMLLNFLANQVVIGNVVATKAYGRIAVAETVAGGLLLLTLPAAYLLIRLGLPVDWAVGCILMSTVANVLAGLWIARRLFGFSPSQWFRKVILRCAAVAVPSVLVALGIRHAMGPSLLRLLLVGAGGAAALLAGSWFWGLDAAEKNFVSQGLRNVRGLAAGRS